MYKNKTFDDKKFKRWLNVKEIPVLSCCDFLNAYRPVILLLLLFVKDVKANACVSCTGVCIV